MSNIRSLYLYNSFLLNLGVYTALSKYTRRAWPSKWRRVLPGNSEVASVCKHVCRKYSSDWSTTGTIYQRENKRGKNEL